MTRVLFIRVELPDEYEDVHSDIAFDDIIDRFDLVGVTLDNVTAQVTELYLFGVHFKDKMTQALACHCPECNDVRREQIDLVGTLTRELWGG